MHVYSIYIIHKEFSIEYMLLYKEYMSSLDRNSHMEFLFKKPQSYYTRVLRSTTWC